MYDPKIGRWLTADPLAFSADDPNLYRYVRNNPTSMTDPSGLLQVIATRTRITGDVATLDQEAANGTPYKDLIKEVLDLDRAQSKKYNMDVPASLSKLGPFFFFNKAFNSDSGQQIPAKSIVGVKLLLTFEWDLRPDDKDVCLSKAFPVIGASTLGLMASPFGQGPSVASSALTPVAPLENLGVFGRELTQVTVGQVSQGDERYFQFVPSNKDTLVRLFKLKNPKGGATYRMVYVDDPGTRGVIYTKNPLGDPVAQKFSILPGSYYKLSVLQDIGGGFREPREIPKSKIDFEFIADWQPNKMTFTLDGAVLPVVEPK
jgi:hypothetical protein